MSYFSQLANKHERGRGMKNKRVYRTKSTIRVFIKLDVYSWPSGQKVSVKKKTILRNVWSLGNMMILLCFLRLLNLFKRKISLLPRVPWNRVNKGPRVSLSIILVYKKDNDVQFFFYSNDVNNLVAYSCSLEFTQ